MQEISRICDVPVNLLWSARKNRDYIFRTPIYLKGVKTAYMTHRDHKEFPNYIEMSLAALRDAYELANANGQSADNTKLRELLCTQWPLVDYNNGNFSTSGDKAALHYLSGTMMLVADVRKVENEYFPGDKVQRAINDFIAASGLLTNSALRHRALISLASARQRKQLKEKKGFVPLKKVLSNEELTFLLNVQARQNDNSITDALNGLKLASVLEMKQAMLKAEGSLLLQDSRFKDLTYEGWSPISPVTDDPDLAYYRKVKTH